MFLFHFPLYSHDILLTFVSPHLFPFTSSNSARTLLAISSVSSPSRASSFHKSPIELMKLSISWSMLRLIYLTLYHYILPFLSVESYYNFHILECTQHQHTPY